MQPKRSSRKLFSGHISIIRSSPATLYLNLHLHHSIEKVLLDAVAPLSTVTNEFSLDVDLVELWRKPQTN
jgi:hypothetical protein